MTTAKGSGPSFAQGNTMVDEPTGEDRANVEELLAEVREFAKGESAESLRSGDWFVRLIRFALESYSKNATAEFFKRKYPGLPADVVAESLIRTAKRYSALEGGASALTYSAAIAATIGSKGGASPLTVPAAVMAFAADMSFTTVLQLRLAHDLAMIYGSSIDLDDPQDVWDLVQVAVGVKASELAREAVAKAAPEGVRQGVKAIVRGPVLQFLKKLPIIGRYIFQRRVAQFAIPFFSVPLNAGMNWWTTSSIAKRAKIIYRDKAAIDETARRTMAEAEADPLLVLRVMYWIVQADEEVSDGEADLLRAAMRLVHDAGVDPDELRAFEEVVNLDEEALLAAVRAVGNLERRAAIYEAGCRTAGIDRDFAKQELAALRKLAEACGVEFHEIAVRALGLATGAS